MKIAMIIDAWEPIVGWWQIHVKKLCEKLILNHDCEIDLFVRSLKSEVWEIFNKDENLLDWKLRIIRCWRSKLFFNFLERVLSIFSITRRVIIENRSRKYDLIHSHSFLWLLSWKIASIVLRLPIVWTIHWANLLDKWEKSFYYYVEKFLLTQIKYNLEITVWSSFLKYKNINKNLKVIGNWINIEEFENVEKIRNKDIYKILFVWRLEWTKWIDILINSINLINRELLDKKNVQIHLVWYWYQENEYKKLVKEFNLEKYIYFRWKIPRKEVVREFKASDLFVLPSRTEWFWITIIEAMAAKIPVIATRCWWPEDIIEIWTNWFLVQKENPQELARMIEKFINWEINNLDRIVENWYEKVVNNYTWDNIWEQTYNEYLKVIKI